MHFSSRNLSVYSSVPYSLIVVLHVYDSQAVMVDQTLYISGIIGLDPKTLTLVPGGVEAEAEQVSFI